MTLIIPRPPMTVPHSRLKVQKSCWVMTRPLMKVPWKLKMHKSKWMRTRPLMKEPWKKRMNLPVTRMINGIMADRRASNPLHKRFFLCSAREYFRAFLPAYLPTVHTYLPTYLLYIYHQSIPNPKTNLISTDYATAQWQLPCPPSSPAPSR